MVTFFQNTDLRRILCSSAAQFSGGIFYGCIWVEKVLLFHSNPLKFSVSASSQIVIPLARSLFQAKDFRTVRDLLLPEDPLQPLRIYDYTENAGHFFLSLLLFSDSESGSVTQTEQNHYPLDVKARIQSDELASLASSASYAQYSDSSFACTPASYDMSLPPKIQNQKKSNYAACLARWPSLTHI